MDKYVNATQLIEYLKREIKRDGSLSNEMNFAIGLLKGTEGVDIQEVKRSEWIHEGKPIHCKNCGFEPRYSFNSYDDFSNNDFCPNCGAQMKGR